MPPHLHRRPPLRQPLPPSGRVLLLPPHQPKASRQPTPTPRPSLHLPPAPARRPLRDPILYRPGPPAHRRQRHRPPPRRSPPLRPPDRQPQPAQAPTHPAQRQTHRNPNRRRDHHRPHPRHPRPARRSLRDHKTQKRRPPTHRADNAKRERRSRPLLTTRATSRTYCRRNSTSHGRQHAILNWNNVNWNNVVVVGSCRHPERSEGSRRNRSHPVRFLSFNHKGKAHCYRFTAASREQPSPAPSPKALHTLLS
jgi:hypothetical protein